MDYKKYLDRPGRKSLLCWTAFCLVLLAAFGVGAQESPAPVLISENDSTRALAAQYRDFGRAVPKKNERIHYPGENARAVLYAYNLTPADGEAADSLRVYAEDREGRIYLLAMVEICGLAEK